MLLLQTWMPAIIGTATYEGFVILIVVAASVASSALVLPFPLLLVRFSSPRS